MRARSTIETLASALAMAALLALAGPGVQVVRADPVSEAPPASPADAPASIEDGPACSVEEDGAPKVSPSQVTAGIAERLRAEMAAANGDTVVLNGRGVNYPRERNPLLEIERLKAEARVQDRQQGFLGR